MSERVHDWVWLDRPPTVEGYAPRRVKLVRAVVGGMIEVVDAKTGEALTVHRGRLSLPVREEQDACEVADDHGPGERQRGKAAVGVRPGEGRENPAGTAGAAEPAGMGVLVPSEPGERAGGKGQTLNA